VGDLPKGQWVICRQWVAQIRGQPIRAYRRTEVRVADSTSLIYRQPILITACPTGDVLAVPLQRPKISGNDDQLAIGRQLSARSADILGADLPLLS
jgi:hypothetical protein